MRRRFWISLTCIAILPLFVAISGILAMAGGWSIRSRLDYALILVSTGWVLLLVVASTRQAVRNWLGQRVFHLLVLFMMMVFALCVGEFTLRMVTPARPGFHLRSPSVHATFKPNSSFLPGISGISNFTTNSQGIRGPEIPGDSSVYRILCVGGSTTECLYLDDKETWPALLMKRLNELGTSRQSWVGNAGISGFGAGHHLRFLLDSELLSSIDCVVLLMGINDLASYTINHPNESRGRAPVWTRLQLFEIIRQRGVLDRVTVEDEDGANYQERRRLRQQWLKTDDMPDLSDPLSDYRSRIESIVATCRRRNVDLVFVTQPVLWTRDDSPQREALLWKVINHQGNCLSMARSRDVMDTFNRTLVETSARLQVPCIDLGALCGIPSLYYDDAHFTEEGAEAVAKAVADWFLQHKFHESAERDQ